MDLEKRRYCIDSLKNAEVILKEMLTESKERTNACLKLHEAALWVESITVEGAEQSLTAERFSNKRRKQRRQQPRKKGLTNSPP